MINQVAKVKRKKQSQHMAAESDGFFGSHFRLALPKGKEAKRTSEKKHFHDLFIPVSGNVLLNIITLLLWNSTLLQRAFE